MTAQMKAQRPTADDATGSAAFDVREVPFSIRGSWLNLSPVVGLHTTADEIHLVSHVNGMHPVVELRPVRDDEEVQTQWLADPASLVWQAKDGAQIEATFDGLHSVRLRGRALQLKVTEASGVLTPFSGAYLFVDPVDDSLVLTSYETGRRYWVRMTKGSMKWAGAEALGRATRSILLGASGEEWEAEIVETTSGTAQPLSRVLRRTARRHEIRLRGVP